jgi:hypothetical protein
MSILLSLLRLIQTRDQQLVQKKASFSAYESKENFTFVVLKQKNEYSK